MHEMDLHDKSCFITLTYATKHLPMFGNLDYSHWQNFAKRWRREIGPFRFLMCGEYGDQFERCHFHAIIYGHDFISSNPKVDRTFSHNTKTGHPLYVSPVLDALWRKGRHTIGNVSFDSVAYCAGYINKKVSGNGKEKHYQRICEYTGAEYDQVPEMGQASRRPGLGADWIKQYHPEVYPRDEVIVNGKSAQPPAYYDRWYKSEFPEKWEEVKEKRKAKGEKWAFDNTPERLAVKERAFKARNKKNNIRG